MHTNPAMRAMSDERRADMRRKVKTMVGIIHAELLDVNVDINPTLRRELLTARDALEKAYKL